MRNPPSNIFPYMEYDRERAFYRVSYPTRERPTFDTQGYELAVHDVSEFGLCFAPDPALPLEVGDVLSGTVRFRNRGELVVEGSVVWKKESLAALELTVPVPFARILGEQRYLRSRYLQVD
jgi:hypothetical protein